MGLDQYILRGKHNIPVEINQDTGDWINAEELLYLRKCYWLHNRILPLGVNKLKLNIDDLNCKYIPITKEEFKKIVSESKEVVNSNSEVLLKYYFDYTPYNEEDFEFIIKNMSEFNKIISRYLKNSKKVEYWYWSWW